MNDSPADIEPLTSDSISESAAQICALANAFKASQALFTAYCAGLFSYLKTRHTTAEVAREMRWEERGAEAVLNALTGQGLLQQTGRAYQVTPLSAACLCEEGEGYLGPYLLHTQQAWTRWNQLGDLLRSGESPGRSLPPPDSDALEAFAWGMDALARVNAGELLRAVDFAGFRNLLDVGGGLGRYAEALLNAYPDLRATIFDIPEVVDWGRKRLETCPAIGKRCAWIGGDFLRDDLGGGYDALLLSNVLHALCGEDIRALLARCHAALLPGGTLLIKDFIYDTDGACPPFTALFGVDMFLHTPKGRIHGAEEIVRWALEAGFGNIRGETLGENARLWRMQSAPAAGG